MRRTAHAHAGVAWKCQRVDFSWTQDDQSDDDDDESPTSRRGDVTEHVTANFTVLAHSLHSCLLYTSDAADE